MKILKNFKILKTGGYDEYKSVEIRMDDTEVFVELPICMIEFNEEYGDPILLGYNGAGIATIIEKQDLIERLKETKLLYFEMKDGSPELVNHKTNLFTRFPKDEDETKYLYDYRDGQIFIIEKQESVGE